MRLGILLAILIPIVAGAQINRSAREFAMENIHEYLDNKMFKHRTYIPLSYGQLTCVKRRGSEITWMIEHRFELEEKSNSGGKPVIACKKGKLWFYLDRRMNVIQAEGNDLY